MTARLDASTMASLVAPSGWTEDNQAIFTARYYTTLMGVRRLRELLMECCPGLVEQSGFEEAFTALSSAPPGAQRQVLGHPSGGFWNDVGWNLVRRRAHERFPRMHLVPHLREFGRFALAALLLGGRGRLSAEVRTDSGGRIALPGTGVCLRPDGAGPYTRVRVTVSDGEVCTTDGLGEPGRDLVPRLGAGPELNWLDRDLRLGGRTPYLFADLAPGEARHWARTLDGYFAIVAEVCPPLAAELAGGLRALVPIRSHDTSVHVSGSFREAPGLVALSLGTPLATMEALVHEYGHQKLYAVLTLDPLIVGDPGEAVHYSPWRDDPRPLSGLLQATFTFVSVLHFYRAVLAAPSTGLDPAKVIARAYQLAGQVADGLAELHTHATFSPLGRALTDTMTTHLADHTASFPLPPAAERDRVDTRRTAHRTRWSERHTPYKATRIDLPVRGSTPDGPDASAAASGTVATAGGVVAGAGGGALGGRDVETLRVLGLPSGWTAGAILGRWYPGDSLLERVRELRGDVVLPEREVGESLVGDLAAAHLAYVRGEYQRAAERYAACVGHDPGSPYFWQCYAFTLRHLGRHDEALYLLTHTAELMAGGRVPDPGSDARRTPEAMAWGLDLPAARPRVRAAAVAPFEAGVAEALRGSRYGGFVEATLGGAQLPTLIAVANGLKPAMDAWIPLEGWQAFLRTVRTLGLRHHVDACFDRYSAQVAQVPPDQLTTTRAAFSPSLRPGTEAHVFLARDRDALDRVVGAGWYPLIVDGKVVNKHRADHDKFGDALGYPPCCQEFFRHRNNWNDDNTYYAALLATEGEPSALCNPFPRHTIYGLVPYMPCSYSCPVTMKFAGRLHDVIAAELPGYLTAMERALSKPLLCVSELKMYWFTGESVHRSGDTTEIRYTAVESLYPIESTDPVHTLLSRGDRCTLDGDILHVHEGPTLIGTHRTRGDRHGPECPFVLTFGP
ncbi:aKG-HExxH-type peptide beta-hydroxylase [Sphaerisporangium aureirubrum]|uniref:HEXXH motif-containing putative peptide modification protein n=1 Tax=Sphaerisporangium aureirubrum TaxID=1544736 RepID=A0ABW1NAP6_9ACTN